MKVTSRGISFPRRLSGRLVSLEIDGRRIWSVTLAPVDGIRVLPLPNALLSRLRGVSRCRVLAGDRELWAGEVDWGGSGSPDLVDPTGRPLVLNKWGFMRPSFERDPHMRERVAASATEVLEVLRTHGFEAFIVGGTLLGAVRSGEILPHDDDADLAYLSPHSHPSDLVIENHRVAALLRANGYRVRRHSWAHLQVLTGEPGLVEYYVDVFTAFYQGDIFNEPIHVREPDMADAILPLSEIELQGRLFPAPRDVDAWLRSCYGPDWRTPDPSFSFETPPDTRRRFDAWFSSFNLGRNPWEERYSSGMGGHESSAIRSHVLAAGDTILDLGSGSGEDLDAYRAAGASATGCDYAQSAPSVHAGAADVNLVDYVQAVKYVAGWLGESTAGPARVVAANHLLACQDPTGRSTIFAVLAMALRAGARVISTDYETLGRYEFMAPRTWHFDRRALTEEAAVAGLDWSLLEQFRHTDEDGSHRDVAVVEFTLAKNANEGALT